MGQGSQRVYQARDYVISHVTNISTDFPRTVMSEFRIVCSEQICRLFTPPFICTLFKKNLKLMGNLYIQMRNVHGTSVKTLKRRNGLGDTNIVTF